MKLDKNCSESKNIMQHSNRFICNKNNFGNNYFLEAEAKYKNYQLLLKMGILFKSFPEGFSNLEKYFITFN